MLSEQVLHEWEDLGDAGVIRINPVRVRHKPDLKQPGMCQVVNA